MTISELLSLVELTKEHLLEKLPPRKTPIKPPAPETFRKPSVKPPPAPLELQKKAPVAKAPLETKKAPKQQERDVNDILELLKTHCPLLKLAATPQELVVKKVILLFDREPQEEKQILINLANALKKEGYEVEVISRDEWDQQSNFSLLIAERSLLLEHPLLFTIPSLAELIAKPSMRREIWNQILENLK